MSVLFSNVHIKISKSDDVFCFVLAYEPKINEKYNFVITEDVYLNNKIFIKKGTKAIGILRKAHQGLYNKGPVSEIKISLFKTTDVNNNVVNLKGAVIVNPMPQLMNIVINPNTTFTLYYK